MRDDELCLVHILDCMLKVDPINVFDQTIDTLVDAMYQLREKKDQLKNAYYGVKKIVNDYDLVFDDSPGSAPLLKNPVELKKPDSISSELIKKAETCAKYYLHDSPISEIAKISIELTDLHRKMISALFLFKNDSGQLNLEFDGMPGTIEALITLTKIASKAPLDLLDSPHPSLARPGVASLIEDAEKKCADLISLHSDLEKYYDLRELSVEGLQEAARTFLNSGSILNIISGKRHRAKKTFNQISKNKRKLKNSEESLKSLEFSIGLNVKFNSRIMLNSRVLLENYSKGFKPIFQKSVDFMNGT